jgi:hypothetical protein
MGSVLEAPSVRFRHRAPNGIDEAIKRSIQEPLPRFARGALLKRLVGLRRLDHSSLNLIRPPSSRTIGANFFILAAAAG